jgi:hypothetical protein
MPGAGKGMGSARERGRPGRVRSWRRKRRGKGPAEMGGRLGSRRLLFCPIVERRSNTREHPMQ